MAEITNGASIKDVPIIVLGFDAADIKLIEEWATQGHLPTFATLLDNAAHGKLDTTSAVLQGSVWTSFATGCNPGKHGSYFLMQMRNRKNEIARIRADHCFRLPFWAWFNGDAEKAVVIDVPKIAPLPEMNGLQVVEWGAFDHYWQYSTSTTEEAKVLINEFGKHPLLEDSSGPRNASDCLRYKKLLIQGVKMKHRLNMGLLEKYQPRILVSVFGETHPAGHYFWRFQDSNYPEYEPNEQMQSALRDVYGAVDEALGELIEKYNDKYTIMIVSGHGICADYNPHYLLQDLLYRMGMTVKPEPSRQSDSTEPVSIKKRVMRGVRNAIPGPIRRILNRYVVPPEMQEQMMLMNAVSGIDFARSKAFCLPSDLQGFIRINLKGREPTGVVSPDGYDAVCQELEDELFSLENSSNGEKVVKKIFRTREVYAGADNLDQLPDLCVLWNTNSPISNVRSPNHGTLEGERKLLERSGNHRPEGFFFASGPNIDTNIRNIRGHILDIAPTIFQLMGKSIPEDLDGVPLPITAHIAKDETR